MEAHREDINRSVVAVTKATDYGDKTVCEAMERQLDLLGAKSLISRGDNVLIKPNFITPRTAEIPAQTHPAVIIALAGMLKDMGAKPFVGDSPAWGSLQNCVDALELTEPLKRMDVPVKHLDRPKRVELPGWDGPKVSVSTVAMEADRIINLPKFKAHQQLGATFAVKNMFGCVTGKRKAYWHFAKGKSYHDFCGMLIGIYKLLGPAMTIIDGIVAMEGTGPIRGQAKPLGLLVGGTDPIACELLCCRLVGFDPMELPIIRTAREIGFGCSDIEQVEAVGDDLQELICPDFLKAKQTPLEFSLSRVCKSVARQLLMLGGSKSD